MDKINFNTQKDLSSIIASNERSNSVFELITIDELEDYMKAAVKRGYIERTCLDDIYSNFAIISVSLFRIVENAKENGAANVDIIRVMKILERLYNRTKAIGIKLYTEINALDYLEEKENI